MRRRRSVSAALGLVGAAAVVVGTLVQVHLPAATRTVRSFGGANQRLTVVEVHLQPTWPLGLVLGGAVLIGAAVLVLLLPSAGRDRVRDA